MLSAILIYLLLCTLWCASQLTRLPTILFNFIRTENKPGNEGELCWWNYCIVDVCSSCYSQWTWQVNDGRKREVVHEPMRMLQIAIFYHFRVPTWAWTVQTMSKKAHNCTFFIFQTSTLGYHGSIQKNTAHKRWYLEVHCLYHLLLGMKEKN